jgi:hypothetical protein
LVAAKSLAVNTSICFSLLSSIWILLTTGVQI